MGVENDTSSRRPLVVRSIAGVGLVIKVRADETRSGNGMTAVEVGSSKQQGATGESARAEVGRRKVWSGNRIPGTSAMRQ